MCVVSLFSNICYVPDTMIIVAKKVDMLPKLMSYLNLERQIKKQKVKLEELASSKRNKRKKMTCFKATHIKDHLH